MFSIFKKAAPATSGPAAVTAMPVWPWEKHTERFIRDLIKSRLHFLKIRQEAIDPEKPDFSGALVELGQSVSQRSKLRELWREMAHEMGAGANAGPKAGAGNFFTS